MTTTDSIAVLNTKRRSNLARLFAPRHIAFIGGNEAAEVVRQCRAVGFRGQMWAVNPKRNDLAGLPCLRSVDDLPEAPDASFLAVPSHATVQILDRLAQQGAGGVVCYAAGFREIGGQGDELERALIDAAGPMAVVGPNCYGLLNYVKGVALWPYGQPGCLVERGAAIITQSGMFAINLTFSQRSAKFSHIISAGNQSILAIEDYIDFLLDEPSVLAIGLHIEMLRNVPKFARVALRAAEKGVPIVALKTGISNLGSRLTMSHTGSLAGSDDAYNALFDRFAITRVDTPAQMIETLKMFTLGGVPKGPRLAAFTCSGGDAEMVADWAEHFGVSLPQPSERVREQLSSQLGPFATVSNPLDYNTAIWGNEERVATAHATFLAQGFDAAIFIQDYPPLGSDIDRIANMADMRGFLTAARNSGVPAAVCSTIPECLTEDVRDLAIAYSAAPLQGIRDGMFAIAAAVRYDARRRTLIAGDVDDNDLAELAPIQTDSSRVLNEYEGKQFIATAGVPIPDGRLCREAEILAGAAAIGFPVAVKLTSEALPHKTEAGAVKLGIQDPAALRKAVEEIKVSAARHLGSTCPDSFLVERMVPKPVAEMMVGIRRDPQFGFVLVLGAGGTQVEVNRDVAILLLPTNKNDVAAAIAKLRIAPALSGYRGQPAGDLDAYCDAVLKLASLATFHASELHELELNPVMVLPRGSGVVAVDALVRIAKDISSTCLPQQSEHSR